MSSSNTSYTLLPGQTAVSVPMDAGVTVQVMERERRNQRNRKMCSSLLCCGALFFLLMFFLIPRTPRVSWTSINASTPNNTSAIPMVASGFEFYNYNFYDTTFSNLQFTVVTTPTLIIVGKGKLEGSFTVGARSSQNIKVPLQLEAGAISVVTECIRGYVQLLLLTDTSVQAEAKGVSHDFGTQRISSSGLYLTCY